MDFAEKCILTMDLHDSARERQPPLDARKAERRRQERVVQLLARPTSGFMKHLMPDETAPARGAH